MREHTDAGGLNTYDARALYNGGRRDLNAMKRTVIVSRHIERADAQAAYDAARKAARKAETAARKAEREKRNPRAYNWATGRERKMALPPNTHLVRSDGKVNMTAETKRRMEQELRAMRRTGGNWDPYR
jgi:ribosomal protein L24E